MLKPNNFWQRVQPDDDPSFIVLTETKFSLLFPMLQQWPELPQERPKKDSSHCPGPGPLFSHNKSFDCDLIKPHLEQHCLLTECFV